MQAEIKICSPPSCVIRGHQSYTLLTLSRLTQFHHHKVFFLLVKKTQEKVEIATQDILLLSAKVSQLMYQCLMGQIKKKIVKTLLGSQTTFVLSGISRYHSGGRYRVSGIRKWSRFLIRGKIWQKCVLETKDYDFIYIISDISIVLIKVSDFF